MAKKTLSAAPATLDPAPKLVKKTIPNIPCALVYYWQFVTMAWNYCKDNLPRFTAQIPLYTAEFVEGQLTLVKETKLLPNRKARNAEPRSLLVNLQAARQAVADMATRLKNAINKSYVAALAPMQRSAAGLDEFEAATLSDWAVVSDFIERVNEYLGKSLAPLVASGSVAAAFKDDFEAVGLAFDNIYTDLKAGRQGAHDGTDAVAEGIKLIKKNVGAMFKDAETIFKYEPELRQLFTQEYLLAQVHSGQIAGIKGFTNLPPVVMGEGLPPKKGKPVANVLVEVLGEEGKTATTDKQGRYHIPIAGGEYLVQYTGLGFEPVVQRIVVSPGKDRRVNVVMEPMVMEALAAPPMAKEATPPPAPVNEEFTNTMKEVATSNGTSSNGASSNGASSNGVTPSQNGHAVV